MYPGSSLTSPVPWMTSLPRWGSGGTVDGVAVTGPPAPDVGLPLDDMALDRSPSCDPTVAQATAIAPTTRTNAMSAQNGNGAFDACRPGDTRGSSSLDRRDEGPGAFDVVGDG
jgi:hypothetical protein